MAVRLYEVFCERLVRSLWSAELLFGAEEEGIKKQSEKNYRADTEQSLVRLVTVVFVGATILHEGEIHDQVTCTTPRTITNHTIRLISVSAILSQSHINIYWFFANIDLWICNVFGLIKSINTLPGAFVNMFIRRKTGFLKFFLEKTKKNEYLDVYRQNLEKW